jgi:cytochrome c biogenesis protein CcmG/thiol:disulfide interchange protein DsbE
MIQIFWSDALSRSFVARWVGVLALFPLIGILVLFGSRLAARDQSSGSAGVNSVGQLAELRQRDMPAIPLRSFDGRDVQLADLRGEVVVVNFWGSWCIPCREEAPALERVWQATRGGDVQFVGVNVWEAESDALNFIREQRVSYLNLLDPAGQLAVELGLTGIPETYFVNRDGKLVRRWVGPISDDRLRSLVAELESESAALTP